MSETEHDTHDEADQRASIDEKLSASEDGRDSPPDPQSGDLPDLTAIAQRMLGDAAAIDISDYVPQETDSKTESPNDSVSEYLAEIADDMLGLMRRMREIENSQQSMSARLESFHEGWSRSSLTTARELDTLRRDLIGDRRHTAMTDMFNELVPMIDRFRTMRDSLDVDADARLIVQLDGVLETLSASLRRLDCQEFDVNTGAQFDPNCMECVGYLPDGEVGVVLEFVRAGYRFDQQVLRPASVKIAAPEPVSPEQNGDDFDE